MPSLTIRLPDAAAAALKDLAEVECRSPKEQAAFLILEGLKAASPLAPPLRPNARAGRTTAEPGALPADREVRHTMGSIGA